MCENAGPIYLLIIDERGRNRGFSIGAFSFFILLKQQQRALSACEKEVVSQGV